MGKLLFFDGGMGTMLQSMGLKDGYPPDLWNLERPSEVRAVHEAYVRAGADILKTNTFGANRLKLSPYGVSVADTVCAAVALAREAAGGRAAVVLDIGPTGKLLSPLGDLRFEEAVAIFAETVKAGVKAGAQAVLIETMSDTYEMKAAVLAAKENSDLPVLCTMIFDERGKLLTGADVPTAAAMLEGLGVSAVGLNCGMGPKAMLPLLRQMRESCSLPLIVNPNAGLPRSEAGIAVYDLTPRAFAEETEPLLAYVQMAGGCCGTTPEHIAALTGAYGGREAPPVPRRETLTVGSYSRSVTFGGRPVVIGERINPTGKKRLQKALRENDTDYLLREGLRQEECGADILDVNVGLPGIDERERLAQAVTELQKVTALPLQLDSSDPLALERALRVYNGRPLINSVNGGEKSLKAVLPLAKKYGGALIALTLDENGIPEDAEGRLAVARRILRAAEEFGIPKSNILFDTLTMPVSASPNSARVTLEALSLIRSELGAKTVLGVSNVSFGLPARDHVSAAFFTMALQRGLSAGIVNPCSREMMSAYDAFCALSGSDAQCENYIARHKGESSAPAPVPAGPAPETAGDTLSQAIVRGLSERAGALAGEAVRSGAQPLEVIDREMVPALDEVGKRYEEGSFFLPQLLMSADAAQAAFAVLRETLGGESTQSSDVIVLATVRGDIHDIGKNIVRVLLENYRFRVIDLGKDVPPEEVVRAVRESGAPLVGLSALMTTTVPAMRETIALLKKECPGCLVMVGGAVLTREYADSIGADFYGKDAMSSVSYAKRVFHRE